jgi:hypothetical protein
MADFPYTPNAASVKRFLEHAQSAGVPEKVSYKYLEKVGFKSKNDRYIVSVLKFIGFLDGTGIPTNDWQAYRNRTTAGVTLANGIRKGYADLFNVYPDAHRKDNEALRNFFSAHTKVADTTLGLIVGTFKMLCSIADFETVGQSKAAKLISQIVSVEEVKKEKQDKVSASSNVSAININIQLQLPATEDATIYDKLFSSLKKHLLS